MFRGPRVPAGAFPHAERPPAESLAIPIYGELTARSRARRRHATAQRRVSGPLTVQRDRFRPAAGRASARSAARADITTQIFIGLLLGILVGYLLARPSASRVKPLADAFLRMIKMIIAPLLFATLVVGIAGTGDLKAMGRIGLKAIIYFEVATTIALFLGLALVNFFQPGAGWRCRLARTRRGGGDGQNQQNAWDIFLHLFPTSVVDAMARGDILQLVVFSIFFGIALAAIGEKGQPLLDVLDSTAHAMFKFTGYVMVFAPVGVFAAIAATVGGKGIGDPVHARQAGRADVPRPGHLRAHRGRRRVATSFACRS